MFDLFGWVLGLDSWSWLVLVLVVLFFGWLSFYFGRKGSDVVFVVLFLVYASFVVFFGWCFASWLGVFLLLEFCFRGIVLFNVSLDDRPGIFLLGWLIPLFWVFLLLEGDYL